MRSRLNALICFTIIFVFIATNSCSDVSQPTSPENMQPIGLSGKVIDNSNQEGVEGVLLQLTDGDIELEQHTESDGTFTFSEVEQGEYILKISPPSGYENIADSEKPVMAGEGSDISIELNPIKEITKTVFEGTTDTLSTSSGAQLIVDAFTSSASLTVSLREVENYNFGENETFTQPVEIVFGTGGSGGSDMNNASSSENETIDISLTIRYSGDPETSLMIFNSGTESEPFLTYADGEKILLTDPVTGTENFVYKHIFSIPSSDNSSATVSMADRDLECDNEYRDFYQIEGEMDGNVPLILIHGLQPTKTKCQNFSDFTPEMETFSSLIPALENSTSLSEQYRLFIYKYPTLTSIEDNASELAELLSDYDEVVIVAHSMGGLVARKAMEEAENIAGLITLGTPHNGSPLADLLLDKYERTDTRDQLCNYSINQKGCPALGLGTTIFPETRGLLDLTTYSPLINNLSPSEKISTFGGELFDIDEIGNFSGWTGPMKRSTYRLGYRYMDEVLGTSGDGMVEIASAVPDWSSYRLIFDDHDHDAIVRGRNGNISSIFSYIESILLSLTGEEDGFQTSDDFALTEESYDEDSDWDQIVSDIMGPDYRVADWNDLVDYYNNYGGEAILEMLDGLGVTERGTIGYLTLNGDRQLTSTRYYFAARHEHNVPGGWAVHASIDNSLISLGSWWNPRPILAIKRD